MIKKRIISIGVLLTSWCINALVGGDFLIGFKLVLATYLGLEAVWQSGGLRTAMGLIYTTFLVKFLLIALAFKLLTADAWEHQLQAPQSTANVMLVGFAALFMFSLCASRVYVFRPKPWARAVATPADALRVGYVLYAVSFIAGMIVGWTSTGRGPILPFVTLSGPALAFVAYYAVQSKDANRWSHGTIIFALEFARGIMSGSKQGIFTPILVVALVVFLRYGFKNLRFILVTPDPADDLRF